MYVNSISLCNCLGHSRKCFDLSAGQCLRIALDYEFKPLNGAIPDLHLVAKFMVQLVLLMNIDVIGLPVDCNFGWSRSLVWSSLMS